MVALPVVSSPGPACGERGQQVRIKSRRISVAVKLLLRSRFCNSPFVSLAGSLPSLTYGIRIGCPNNATKLPRKCRLDWTEPCYPLPYNCHVFCWRAQCWLWWLPWSSGSCWKFCRYGIFPGSRSLLVFSMLSLAAALSLFLLYQAPLVSWQARRSIPAA